ncbi:hypothetical protein [Fodinibius sp.]|uniref:hypothetical protein n=1 Tax=Fodinibius sp. TaxID=1872440 RepID=UPI002ACEBC20|nr:hypothetical protein [Fodinibius sp.]MDZ7659443.1 hypothetical protein [Fodinibius sp.]
MGATADWVPPPIEGASLRRIRRPGTRTTNHESRITNHRHIGQRAGLLARGKARPRTLNLQSPTTLRYLQPHDNRDCGPHAEQVADDRSSSSLLCRTGPVR